MKRYQLIGRRRTVAQRPAPLDHGPWHIHSLPTELLVKIFSYILNDNPLSNDPVNDNANCNNNINDLLTLSLVCHRFHNIISKYLLYKRIQFRDMDKFLQFTKVHLPNKPFGINDISTKVNFIQDIEFINPPIKNSKDHKMKIAGSYDVETRDKSSNQITFEEFNGGLKSLINDNYNLKQIIISEISPQFVFDDLHEESSSFLKRHKPKPKRSLQKLVLKAQSGWSILFRLNHLSTFLKTFDSINELELHNFIIDGTKLSQVSLIGISTPVIDSLCLYKCSFINRNPKGTFCDLFKYTTHLKLVDILKSLDLSMIDFIKANNCLNYLSIDSSSGLFYENGQFNFRVFNPFFKLICSHQGNYGHIKVLVLDNFDLFYQYSHNHRHGIEMDNPPIEKRQNLMELLNILSSAHYLIIKVKYPHMMIQTCKKCGFLKPEDFTPVEKLTNRDWSTLLKPLLDNETRFRILNHNLTTLYENS